MTDAAFDVLVVGAGMAGASLAAALAPGLRVGLLEQESQPGYHSTGRSAALFSETYGKAPVRALSRASRAFLWSPPAGFTEHPLVGPRGVLHIARADQAGLLEAFLASPDIGGSARAVDAAEAMRLCPILRPDRVLGGVHEPDASDMDVHALHQGFLRQARAGGGVLVTDARVDRLEQAGAGWRARTPAGVFEAPIVVNAAGAWADAVAALAGVRPIGIEPRRRTAVLVDAPEGVDIRALPTTIDIAETYYFKPESGQLLLSPADETPSVPCDAQPEDEDVAIAVDRYETATGLPVNRLRRKWAGLRSFAPDRNPVIGYDVEAGGFFWLAGQGGYGIQTAPAAGRLAAAILRREGVPEELAAFGVREDEVSPRRFAPVAA